MATVQNVFPDTEGNSFDCSPNTHETTVLLPNVYNIENESTILLPSAV